MGLDIKSTLSLGFMINGDLNQSSQIQRLARKLKFCMKQFRYNIFLKAKTCIDWSATLLLAYPRQKVSCIEVYTNFLKRSLLRMFLELDAHRLHKKFSCRVI